MRPGGEQPQGYVLPQQLGNGISPLAFASTLLEEIDLQRIQKYVIVKVEDDAMEPTLKLGELALAVVTGDGAGAAAPGKSGLRLLKDGRIRRVQWRHDSTAVFSCDNPLYRPEITTWKPGDPDLIRGRVIWRGGPI